MKKALKVLTLLILCLGMFFPVAAEEGDPVEEPEVEITKEFPDLSKKGSITVNFKYKESEDNIIPVTDGTFAIWELAKAIVVTTEPGDGGFKFSMLSDVGSYATGYRLKEDGSDFSGLLDAAKSATKPSDLPTISNSSGTITFSDLECGVYLVFQTEGFSDYKDINPFLVTIPFYDTDDNPTLTEDEKEYKALYDVTADVKMELEPETELLNPCVADPPVTKIVDGNGAPDVEFEFYFERMEDANPMPVGHDGYVVDDNITGTTAKAGETKEFGEITFTRPGTYYYRVYEVKEGNGEPNFTYDTTVYIYGYNVIKNGENLTFDVCRVYIEGESEEPVQETEQGQSPDTVYFEFTNKYKKPAPPDIPFTGQHWWPMYVLIVSGVILTGLGIYRRKQAR